MVELLSNTDLEELCNTIGIHNLMQVCSKNNISMKPRQQCSYILNLDLPNNEGTHWVCIYIKGKQAIYFDSFGQLPPEPVIQFFHKHNLQWINNESVIQDIHSKCCGYFCLGFLWCLYNGYTLSQYIEQFNTLHQKKNDKCIQQFIRKILKNKI